MEKNNKTNKSPLDSNKKGVFIRIPESMYEDLLNLSAAATLMQRKNVSVPAMIFQILDDTLKGNRSNLAVPFKR